MLSPTVDFIRDTRLLVAVSAVVFGTTGFVRRFDGCAVICVMAVQVSVVAPPTLLFDLKPCLLRSSVFHL